MEAIDKRLNNEFWKLRSKHGPDKLFTSPEILWDAVCEYFTWAQNNPLLEDRLFGTGLTGTVEKMRAFTLDGLYTFLDISQTTWKRYRDTEEFKEVIEKVQRIIYDQKFVGAAAGLLNSNLISRDLGLIDHQEQKIVTGGGEDLSKLSDEELQQYLDLKNKLSNGNEQKLLPAKPWQLDSIPELVLNIESNGE